jgi:outer membrane protein OmpA-like peptidoglycan-associated protein
MEPQGIRQVLAVFAAIWGGVGICAGQSPEVMSGWQFPKAADLVFPKATDLQFPQPTDLAAQTTALEIHESSSEIRIDLSADVLFDFDKATLSEKAHHTLEQAASIIREKAKGQVTIDGHTDSKGDERYNLRLSERRASAVKLWFVEKAGLPENRFVTHGYGEQRPVVSNTKSDGSDDPDGRQKNRRVEIVFSKSNNEDP